MHYIIDVIFAYVLDLILGDPYSIPHPVRFIGSLIKNTEVFFRKRIIKRLKNKALAERISGFFLCAFVVCTVFVVVFGILKLAEFVSPILFHVINIYIIYTAFATKCLADEAGKVYKKLDSGTIQEAREALSMLVGRDTSKLSEEGVIKGVVETTAENTVDAVISPILFALAGSCVGLGAPIVYAFKAVSTLDSMVGYKNDKYKYLGTASARLDDILNFIPARISIFIIPLASEILGFDGKRSFRISIRDRYNHLSPNSAHAESAVAGALGIRLGGPNIYFGKVVDKPYIGDSYKAIEKKDIKSTINILYLSSLITIIFFSCIIYFIKFNR